MSLLFKITYGLYVLSAKEGKKSNACVINTVMQQTAVPETISVTINKDNYTHDLVKKSGVCAVSVLDTSTTFALIQNFGMQSGRDGIDKFEEYKTLDTKSGIKVLDDYSLGYMELKVLSECDMGTHTMFICEISESVTSDINKNQPLTYAYYHAYVKPQPQAKQGVEMWVCKVCGYMHEGEPADDYICPLCKHGKADFEKFVPRSNNVVSSDDCELKWVCSICGYSQDDEPANDFICPLCNHGKADFIKE